MWYTEYGILYTGDEFSDGQCSVALHYFHGGGATDRL